jgi:chemosensory pili system protein ChpA (sensor histidine kinase/response regulator)
MVATDALLAEAALVEATEPETLAAATSAVDPPWVEADDVLVAEMVAPANTADAEDEPIVETVKTNAPVTAPVLAEPVDVEEGAAWRLARAELAAVQSAGGEQWRSDSGTGDEDDRQLAELFADEVAEGLLVLHAMVAQLTEPEGAHGETVLALQRQVHTLKGAAAMMGRQSFATLTHRMEDVLERLAAKTMPLTPAVVGLLFDTVDVLGTMARMVTRLSVEPLIRYPRGRGWPTDSCFAAGGLPPCPCPARRASDRPDNSWLMGSRELARAPWPAGWRPGGLLRDFDRSIERLGRVSRALEADYEAWGVAGEQRVVADLDDFDALELDRYTEFRRLTIELLEAVADARTVNRDVTSALTSMTTLVGRQGRVASAIRKGLETASLVALTGLAPMARRVASQAALTEGSRGGRATRPGVAGRSHDL